MPRGQHADGGIDDDPGHRKLPRDARAHALEFGDVNGTEDVKAFFKQVGKKCADEKAKLAELEKLYEMSFGLQGRSASTLAEEENRLLVGGVVVKKKD